MFPNWLQSDLPREVLEEKYLKISFSQNGEDDFIRSYFWNKIMRRDKGTYLDIGCFSDTLYSNTKMLSLIGWQGLAVDANPDLKSSWLLARPQDTFMNRCVIPSASTPAELKFFRFHDGAMSTASIKRAYELVSEGWPMLDVLRVPSVTLREIADTFRRSQKDFPDVISIDLEMVDFLDDLPEFLLKLRPRLLCMEPITHNLSLSNIFGSREVEKLAAANYEPVSLIGGNIFAAPSRI